MDEGDPFVLGRGVVVCAGNDREQVLGQSHRRDRRGDDHHDVDDDELAATQGEERQGHLEEDVGDADEDEEQE